MDPNVNSTSGSSAADLASAIGPRLAKDALIAVIDGDEADLGTKLHEGADVEIVTPGSDRGLHTLRHSTAHVMAQAVSEPVAGCHLRHRSGDRERVLLRLRASRRRHLPR